MHRDEHLGGVGYLPEAGSRHFKDGELTGGAKAVLDAAEHAVRTAVFPFKLQHHIHNMFQNLGARDGAFLGNMADEDDRNATGFSKAEELRRHLFDLAHAAGSGFHVLAVHGLDGVHDHEVGSHFLGFGQDGAHIGLAEDEAVVAGAAQAVGPHFHLLDGLFSGDVQRL